MPASSITMVGFLFHRRLPFRIFILKIGSTILLMGARNPTVVKTCRYDRQGITTSPDFGNEPVSGIPQSRKTIGDGL